MVLQEHVIDLIPAYALNCLDGEETAQVVEHLQRCQECQAELRAYQSVVDQLPLAVLQVEPSQQIKHALLARVEQVPSPEEKPSVWVRFKNGFKVATPAWGLASLALVAVLLFSNLALWRQVSQLQANPGATALRVVNLAGTDFAPDASGIIVISQDGEHGTLVVDDLPDLSSEQQYQLWLIQDGQRTDGGVFSVKAGGYAAKVIYAPLPLADYNAFGVTIEPAGGSPGPTGEKVLGGNL
jgi:anti-sigma-K factor RskA